MAFALGDIFIGSFPITQNFGDNEQMYKALYGLNGHNGTDFGCPTGTPILAAADGVITFIGSEALNTFDTGGFGNYVKINHNGYFTLYGHLNDSIVNVGDHVVAGQLIGHSNNTGNSTGPHLHFGVAPCDVNGNKIQPNNGFSGYIDPMGSDCQWTIKNLTAPIVPGQNSPVSMIEVKDSDFVLMVGQGSSYKVVCSYLLTQGLNTYLSENGRQLVDINDTTPHPTQGNDVVAFLQNQFSKLAQLQQQIQLPKDPTPQQAVTTMEQTVGDQSPTQQTNFFSGVITLLQGLHILQK